MKCQNCGSDKLGVEKTEKYDTCNRRIVQCKKCGWSITTVEKFMDACQPKHLKISLPTAR